MDETENAFPMDFWAEDPSPHPWKFRPEGYLVVILSDEAAGTRIEEVVEAARAEAEQLRRVAREREGEATRGRGRRAPSVSDANLALVEDPELLVLVERLITTPRAARRGILDLLTALRDGG